MTQIFRAGLFRLKYELPTKVTNLKDTTQESCSE
ncbi:Uncharacterised protein [Halioglobus japonicus]|nr:Uncharacterised protein [Halioglobus japonicus]